MFEKAVNGFFATVLGVICLGVIAALILGDISLIATVTNALMEVVVRVGVAVIIVAFFVSIGKEMLESAGLSTVLGNWGSNFKFNPQSEERYIIRN